MRHASDLLWLAMGVTAALVPRTAQAGMPPMPTEVAPAVRGRIYTVLPGVGTVRPLREVSVGSKIAERVAEVLVDEGDSVKKGQVICRLDATETKLLIQQAKANVASAEAELADRKAGLRENEIKQAEAAVAEQKARVRKLELDADRVKSLFAKGVVADAERDSVLAEYDTAVARLEGAEAALALAREGTRKELIAKARAELDLQEAQLALADQKLADSTIHSPVDGYVVRKHIEVGEWAQVGATVVELIDTSILRVHTQVTEKQVRNITEGQRAEVRLDAHAGRKFEAAVHRIIPEAETSTRSFPVQLNLTDPESIVRAGMFARVAFILGEREGVLLVPEDAIVYRGGHAMLFKAAKMPMPPQAGPPKGGQGGPPGGKPGNPQAMAKLPGPMMVARRVVVDTGARQEGRIEIAKVVDGSLAAGDLVVVVGSENLREGSMMIVVRGLPKGGPAAEGGPARSGKPPARPAEPLKGPSAR